MAEDSSNSGGGGLKGPLAEAMKKVLIAGVGTVFMTEEAVRSALGDLKLPKEMWTGLLENAQKTKTEFLGVFAREMTQVFSKVNLQEEVKKLLLGQKIKVQIEFSLEPKDGHPKKAKQSKGRHEKN